MGLLSPSSLGCAICYGLYLDVSEKPQAVIGGAFSAMAGSKYEMLGLRVFDY